jgi:PDZ domain-containing protein/aspartyl protease
MRRFALSLFALVVGLGAADGNTWGGTGHDVTLPFQLANLNVYLQVKVPHSRPLWFLLDTGVKPALIDLRIARSLGLSLGDSVVVGGGGKSPVIGYLLHDSPYQVVGLLGFEAPLVLAMPFDDLSRVSGRELDGILGYDFIHQFVVEIDYVGHTLTLHDTTGWSYRGKGQSFPITFNAAAHPQLRAKVVDGGRPPVEGTFVVDLGSGAAVILDRPFVEEQHFLGSDRPTVPWLEGQGIGGKIEGRVGRIGALELGRFRIKNPVVVFSQAESGPFASLEAQGNIGAAILEKFRVFLDYPRNRIVLEPNRNLSRRIDYNRTGFSLSASGADLRTYTIKDVALRSPASEAGFQAGDQLVAVDGRPAARSTLSDLRLHFRDARRCSITVKRGGVPMRAVITLRSPI